MSDFHQTGVVATFHRLGKVNLEKLESELSWYSQERPIALILPSLYSELQGKALKTILDKLKDVKYVNDIVVTLGGASEADPNAWEEHTGFARRCQGGNGRRSRFGGRRGPMAQSRPGRGGPAGPGDGHMLCVCFVIVLATDSGGAAPGSESPRRSAD